MYFLIRFAILHFYVEYSWIHTLYLLLYLLIWYLSWLITNIFLYYFTILSIFVASFQLRLPWQNTFTELWHRPKQCRRNGSASTSFRRRVPAPTTTRVHLERLPVRNRCPPHFHRHHSNLPCLACRERLATSIPCTLYDWPHVCLNQPRYSETVH